jgi:hypothetical protein
MRTKALLTVAAALSAGVIGAQAQVYSVNIVGYVNQELAGGGAFTAVANPLDDGANTLDSLFNGVMPDGGTVQFWNGAGFDVATKVPDFLGGWSGLPGDTELPPGVGVFVSVGADPVTKTWVGDVLTGDLSNPLPAGFSFKGNQAPVAGTAGAIGLGDAMAEGDVIQKWNGAGWDAFTKVPEFLGSWSPSEPTVNVAEGIFVNVAAEGSWDQTFNP